VLGIGRNEATANYLSRIPGSPASKQPSHVGAHRIEGWLDEE
jgi:hypothetical protein